MELRSPLTHLKGTLLTVFHQVGFKPSDIETSCTTTTGSLTVEPIKVGVKTQVSETMSILNATVKLTSKKQTTN